MCGRYALSDELCDEMKLIVEALDARYPRSAWHFGDIRPSDAAPVLVLDAGRIHARLFSWGFPLRNSLVINARAESAAARSMFAECLAKRRCVIPAAGFYEWDQAKGKHFYTADGGLLYMAGLFDQLAGKLRYCILTTAANDAVRGVHPRMPLVLLHSQVRQWLDEPQQSDSLLRLTPPPLRAI